MNDIKRPPLLGYADRLSARPGDEVQIKVSSALLGSYQASLVRIVSADPNPDGIGIVEHDVESDFQGSYPARSQDFTPGSYMAAKLPDTATLPKEFFVSAKIWPTLISRGSQIVFSIGSANVGSTFRMGLNESGQPEAGVLLANGDWVTAFLPVKIRERKWADLWASYSSSSNTISIGFHDSDIPKTTTTQFTGITEIASTRSEKIIVAANQDKHASLHFNGKIEAPKIFDNNQSLSPDANLTEISALPVFASWDFSIGIPTTKVHDIGPYDLDGQLINYPSRAMTSSNWDGSEMSWNHSPGQYAAIHFHEDDIYDFGWETDFVIKIPKDHKSGIYGIRLEQDQYYDTIPLFICPPKGKRTARLAYLASTFTYTIYGNHARPDYNKSWLDKIANWNAYPWNPAEFPEYGLSTYNFHSDRSGICHASYRRPLFNLRSGYLTFGASECSGLRHFQADSHLTSWMENQGYEFDVITDYELDAEGVELLNGYSMVTTGSHPEYHTKTTLDALQQYRDQGGKLAYLGGNGFYWRIATHPENNSLIEIRRGEGGIRAWAAEPGEYYNAFDGIYGGLWRRSGRPPQMLAGVGFSSQGQFYGSYYRRTSESYSEEFNWMFKNIDDDLIGEFGFSGNGAAGFELDRYDPFLGSPENATVVASSENHNSTFVLVPEEQLTHLTNLPGVKNEELIRADMLYFENSAGGAVFSTGSITFCGSLPFNNFDNNISKLLSNIFNRFLSAE